MSVSIVDNKIETDLFCKLTDCHEFLQFNSAHPFHNKKSIVCSQGLRIKRLSSSSSTFQKHLENLKTWFCKRGYPQKVVDAQIKRVPEKCLDELFERPDSYERGVPLVLTYHPRFYNLRATIRKYFTFLYAEEKVLATKLLKVSVYFYVAPSFTSALSATKCTFFPNKWEH